MLGDLVSMDLLYPESSQACYSDSELSNMELESSLKRHSHFFLPPSRSNRPRPRSVPLLPSADPYTTAASPMMTVLDDDSSSERIDRVSDGTTDGGGETEELNVGATDKEGIR